MNDFILNNWIVIVIVAVLYLVGRFTGRSDEGLLSRLFKSNKDFDTTAGLIGVIAIVLFMLMSFHDDLAEHPSTLGMIFIAAFNLIQTFALGKHMNGHGGDSSNKNNGG